MILNSLDRSYLTFAIAARVSRGMARCAQKNIRKRASPRGTRNIAANHWKSCRLRSGAAQIPAHFNRSFVKRTRTCSLYFGVADTVIENSGEHHGNDRRDEGELRNPARD